MALGYRAVARLDKDADAIEAAEKQLEKWFDWKKSKGQLHTARWDGPGDFLLGPSANLSVVYAPDSCDGTRRRLYRFAERNNDGLWTVSLSALSTNNSRSPQTLVVELDTASEDTKDAVWNSAPPRLIQDILSDHAAFDGRTPLTGQPLLINTDDVAIVRDAILDSDRTASVIVAPLPWSDGTELWNRAITSLTRQSTGVATTFILDENATAQLSTELPPSHGIQKGVIRTFVPQVDIDSAEDGYRHLKLHPATLVKHIYETPNGAKVSDALAKTLALSTRLRFIERDIPDDVRHGISMLRRANTQQRRQRTLYDQSNSDTVMHAPLNVNLDTTPTERRVEVSAGLLKDITTRWLDHRPEPDAVLMQLDDLLNRRTTQSKQWEAEFDQTAVANERLEDQLREERSRVEGAFLDAAIAEEENRRLARESSILRQRLVETGRSEDAHVEKESATWESPDTVVELIDRITPGKDPHLASVYVVFTGNEKDAQDMDTYETLGRYARAFWDFVHVLYDYAVGKAKGRFACGVHLYLNDDRIVGHKCHPDRHASKESESTLNQWKHERILPVPPNVDPSGKVLMEAHFKPTRRDTVAPRMHYFDDTDNTGKIYVGYIGSHMTTKKTKGA